MHRLLRSLSYVFLASIIHALPGHAQGPVIVSCRFDSPSIPVGGEAAFHIEIQNVTDLYGYQFELLFPPSVGQALGELEPGTFLDTGEPWIVKNTVKGGTYAFAMTIISGSSENGSGELASGRMKGLIEGWVFMSFEGVVLSSPEGRAIAFETEGCMLAVGNPPPPNPTGTPGSGETPTPTSTSAPASGDTPTPSATPNDEPSALEGTPTAIILPPEEQIPPDQSSASVEFLSEGERSQRAVNDEALGRFGVVLTLMGGSILVWLMVRTILRRRRYSR